MRSLIPWTRGSWLPTTDRFARAISRMEREMEDLMSRFYDFEEGWLEPDVGFVPRTNVVELEKQFEVTLELPGLKPEEVTVEFKNGNLWVSGEKIEEKEEEGKTFHRKERFVGKFRRVLPFPAKVNEEKIDARFEHGVLKIIVPKLEMAMPKHIEVKAE